jgi:hypothetical protein
MTMTWQTQIRTMTRHFPGIVRKVIELIGKRPAGGLPPIYRSLLYDPTHHVPTGDSKRADCTF